MLRGGKMSCKIKTFCAGIELEVIDQNLGMESAGC